MKRETTFPKRRVPLRAVKRTNSIGFYRSRERFHQISLKSAAESHFVFQESARVVDDELVEASSCSCSVLCSSSGCFPWPKTH